MSVRSVFMGNMLWLFQPATISRATSVSSCCAVYFPFVQMHQSTQLRGRRQKWRISIFLALFVMASGALATYAWRELAASSVRTNGGEPVASTSTPSVAPPLVPLVADPAPPSDPVRPAGASVSTHAPRRPNSGLSVAATLTALPVEELEKQLDDMRALHVAWIRLDFDWSVIQRRDPDTYDWTRVDRVIAAAHERGFNVLPILVYTPVWARPDGCSSERCPPADVDEFARFAGAVAARFSPRGVSHYEIWNEPNAVNSWRPASDPVAYTRLLRASYEAIKDVDENATVIMGGLAVIDSRNGSVAPREFLGRMYDAGAKPYFDAAAYHPYSFPATPTYAAAWNGWQQMNNTSPSLRSIMKDNGDSAKKIWLTEFGAPTGGPGDASNGYVPGTRTTHVTEDLQARMLQEAFREVDTYDWAGPLFWYSYKDIGTSRETPENFYGIRRNDGSLKPAYGALQEL